MRRRDKFIFIHTFLWTLFGEITNFFWEKTKHAKCLDKSVKIFCDSSKKTNKQTTSCPLGEITRHTENRKKWQTIINHLVNLRDKEYRWWNLLTYCLYTVININIYNQSDDYGIQTTLWGYSIGHMRVIGAVLINFYICPLLKPHQHCLESFPCITAFK